MAVDSFDDKRLRTYLRWIKRTSPTDAGAYHYNNELYREVYSRGFVELKYPPYPAILVLTNDGEDFILVRVLKTLDYRMDYKSRRRPSYNRSIEISVSADFPKWVNLDLNDIIKSIIGGGPLSQFPDSEWVKGELKTIEGDEELIDDISVEIEYVDYDVHNRSWSDGYTVETTKSVMGLTTGEFGNRAMSEIKRDLITSALDIADSSFVMGLRGKARGIK